MDEKKPPYAQVGERLRRLREHRSLSRRVLAEMIEVDVTSIAGWESGKRLPRARLRPRVARALGTDAAALFTVLDGDRAATPVRAALVDAIDELPPMLIELTREARCLRALRIAAPYVTPAYVQTHWRTMVGERLLTGALEVQRIEIFYDLRRLQETVSNIFRYAGRRYYVKSYCAGLTEVVPAMGAYLFDDDEVLLGAYWAGIPPHHRPGLRVAGAPFQRFFNDYWHEIWGRGTLLNVRAPGDLSEVREVALKLGLPESRWEQFVEEAKALEIGDGAPPLV